MSERVTTGEQKKSAPAFVPAPDVKLQRECSCAGVGGECAECQKKRAASSSYSAHQAGINTQADTQPRTGHDFGRMTVHARSPRALQAKLNISQPGDPYEREADLVAERVSHGLAGQPAEMSSHPGQQIQRSPAVTPSEPSVQAPPAIESEAAEQAPPLTLIVEDRGQEPGPGQMRKTEFLDELQRAICAEADAELARVGRNTEGCPYIERWIGFYRAKSSDHVERALRRYAPEAAGVTSAREYIPLVAARVRRAVAVWAATGQITGVPEELASQLPTGGLLGAVGGVVAGVAGVLSSIGGGIGRALGGIFAKGREGGAREAGDPGQIQAQLGGGRPLDGGAKARMESAFGYDFSRVRVHNDGRAAELSNNLNARAFTIGSDVAFAAGEYRPGTLVGDALLAHELAHVVQQGSADGPAQALPKDNVTENTLEQEADNAAVSAVSSLWGGTRWLPRHRARGVRASLKSRLRLQRCATQTGTRPSSTTPSQEAAQPAGPIVCEPNRSLTWDDFTGTPKTTGKAESLFRHELAFVDGKQVVRAVFRSADSWVVKAFKDTTDRKATKCDQSIKGCEKFFGKLKKGQTGTQSLSPLPGCAASIAPNPAVVATSKAECQTILGPECDRVAGLESARLLKHEQLHFDIACVLARRGTQLLMGPKPPNAQTILDAVRTKANELSAPTGPYDTDTRHGCNATEQTIWEGKVAGGLTDVKIP